MVVERNGWFATDDMQYCKKIDENNYHLIEARWADIHRNGSRAESREDEDDNYGVCSAWIDLELYDKEDIESILHYYSYTMESVKEIYGDCMNQIIAECLFEELSFYECNIVTGVVSMKDVEKAIQKYIDEN